MSSLLHNDVLWPPENIRFLRGLKQPCGQAMVKHVDKGHITGMAYRVEGADIYIHEKLRKAYFIEIDAWDYTIRNESREYPVLSFSYLDILPQKNSRAVQNVRLMGRYMRGQLVAEKTLRTASYFMRHIELGDVPDVQHVLSLYKLLPVHPLMAGFVQNSFSEAHSYLKSGE